MLFSSLILPHRAQITAPRTGVPNKSTWQTDKAGKSLTAETTSNSSTPVTKEAWVAQLGE